MPVQRHDAQQHEDGGPTQDPNRAPNPDAEPLLDRPDSAVDIIESDLVWCVRASWIRYVSSGRDVVASGGAFPVDDPPVKGIDSCDRHTATNTSAELVYRYGFTPLLQGASWVDPSSERAYLAFGGTVAFRYPSRGIAIKVSNPELVVEGESVVMHVETQVAGEIPGSTEFISYGPVSESLTSGGPWDLGRLDGVLTASGSEDLFDGMYPVGADFGWAEIRFAKEAH